MSSRIVDLEHELRNYTQPESESPAGMRKILSESRSLGVLSPDWCFIFFFLINCRRRQNPITDFTCQVIYISEAPMPDASASLTRLSSNSNVYKLESRET